jgi:hypothetical protein
LGVTCSAHLTGLTLEGRSFGSAASTLGRLAVTSTYQLTAGITRTARATRRFNPSCSNVHILCSISARSHSGRGVVRQLRPDGRLVHRQRSSGGVAQTGASPYLLRLPIHTLYLERSETTVGRAAWRLRTSIATPAPRAAARGPACVARGGRSSSLCLSALL